VEKSVEWELTGKTEVLWENLHQCTQQKNNQYVKRYSGEREKVNVILLISLILYPGHAVA
jgi:hypothetical protein